MKFGWIYFALIWTITSEGTYVIETEKHSEVIYVDQTPILTSCPAGPSDEGVFVFTLEPFRALCDTRIAGAGYLVIASRSNVSENFFRNWQAYKNGFGDLFGDFFIGLDRLHAITKSQTHELYIHLEDFEGNTRFARYDEFYIENENEFYKLSKLGAFTGDAGDSLVFHKNEKFSTYDKDKDPLGNLNCAINHMGAWWYHKGCHHSNLFGMYLGGTVATGMEHRGITWRTWRTGSYSYKTMKMMVRPKCRCS